VIILDPKVMLRAYESTTGRTVHASDDPDWMAWATWWARTRYTREQVRIWLQKPPSPQRDENLTALAESFVTR
jgi:hypothetical protein